MVPNSLWPLTFLVPKTFGPRESWAPKKFSSCMKIIIWHFHARTSILGAQISLGPNFLGTKKVRGQNEIGDHFSYSQALLYNVSHHKWAIIFAPFAFCNRKRQNLHTKIMPSRGPLLVEKGTILSIRLSLGFSSRKRKIKIVWMSWISANFAAFHKSLNQTKS